MYRTADPRFRRRLNELENTLERANESAQSGLYIFGQNYLKPCFASITTCVTSCIDASCPSLNLSQRDRIRRQRGRARSRGRAELNFDFYDDWDEEETDGLIGWGNEGFDSLVGAGSASRGAGYGTITSTQPARQRGMNYPDGIGDANVMPGSSLFGKLFGGKALRYKPTAAGLKDNPGAMRLGRDVTEGEALLGDVGESDGVQGKRRRQGRNRSDTAGSGHTSDSYSSRGDILPSDEEDDAIPLDDEFAMVLERRTTNSGFASGPETENDSPSGKRSKRPSLGGRSSTRRTVSSRSTRSSNDKRRRRRRSSAKSAQILVDEETMPPGEVKPDALLERPQVEIAQDQLDAVKGEDTTASQTLSLATSFSRSDEPSQLPTPTATDDEQDDAAPAQLPVGAAESKAHVTPERVP